MQIPPRRGILTASNQNRPVKSENEYDGKQVLKDTNTKTTSTLSTRVKTTTTAVFQKRRPVLNDVSNAKLQQKVQKPMTFYIRSVATIVLKSTNKGYYIELLVFF